MKKKILYILAGTFLLSGLFLSLAKAPIQTNQRPENSGKHLAKTFNSTQEETSTQTISQLISQTSSSTQETSATSTTPTSTIEETSLASQSQSLTSTSLEQEITSSTQEETSTIADDKLAGSQTQTGAPFIILYTNPDGVTRRSPVLFSSQEEAQTFAAKIYPTAKSIQILAKGTGG